MLSFPSPFFLPSFLRFLPSIPQPAPAELRALLEFLQAHAGDGVLDAAAMAQLNGEVLPAALAAWPVLREVLETKVAWFRAMLHATVFNWTAGAGFAAPLTQEQVFALTNLLTLKVGLPTQSRHVLLCFIRSVFLKFLSRARALSI